MEISKELEELNTEEAKQYIGGVVFVTLIMIVGIVGNAHVLYVYSFRMKPSNHRLFILTLAVLDTITCLIGMPFIIVDLRNPLTFTMVSACKVLRFVNYFICASSALLLTVIAVDRYRKICVPLGKQISRGLAKGLILVCLGVALVLSWPAPVLYGHGSVNTTNPNITGVRCYTQDIFKDTKYQAYFNAVLILVVFGVLGILVVLYSLIGRTISRHVTFKSSVPDSKSPESKSKETETSDTISHDDKISDDNKMNIIATNDQQKQLPPDEAIDKTTDRKQKERKGGNFDRAKRTTFMFFLITVFFFLSYVPHLILKIVAFVNTDFVPDLTFTGKVFYNTFVWCFFINNMANCFIYGFCDLRFRKEVKKIYTTLFSACPCRR